MKKRQSGFTLIELLIVIVIIGILAAIAIPKFSKTREKAFIKAMTSDLRNLATQQELYYNEPANSYQYADLSALEDDNLWHPTQGVDVTLTNGGSTGWSAIATHTSTTWECGMAYGDVTGSAPADSTGKVYCIDGGGGS